MTETILDAIGTMPPHEDFRTYRITMPSQFPGHRPTRLIRARITREARCMVTLTTEQGSTYRRDKHNVREVQPAPQAQAVAPIAPQLPPYEDRLQALVARMRGADWFYEMSDDHRTYLRGRAAEHEMRREYQALYQVNPGRTEAVIRQQVSHLPAWVTSDGWRSPATADYWRDQVFEQSIVQQ